MHWVDVISSDLLERSDEHVIASGTSISGVIHMGNAGDIIIGDGIARAVRENGGSADLLWVMDDVDPLRSIPEGVPQEFERYLGVPDFAVPDPWGCHASFTEHFSTEFLDSLRDIDVRPRVISGAEMYRCGEYEDAIRTALARAAEIRGILRKVSGTRKGDDWLPFEAICGNCGRISTTRVYAFDGGSSVRYRCVGGVAGRKDIPGCGHEGESDLRSGKLPWRVEWAARWRILGVTCEPFGKEHAAAGGSFDTCRRIVTQVFDHPAPHPVPYEFILVRGAKMSSSKGNVFTVRDMLDAAPPDLVRFFFFRTYPWKHKDFSFPEDVLGLMDDFERFERVAHGSTREGVPEKEVDDVRRAYALSRLGEEEREFVQVPYRHLLVLADLYDSWPEAVVALRRCGYPVDAAHPTIRKRFTRAKHYVERFVRERLRVTETPPPVDLTPDQCRFLGALADRLDGSEWTPTSIHQSIHEVSKGEGLSARDAFGAVYLSLLGRRSGPRAGYFLTSLEPSFVLHRFRQVPRGGGKR